VTARRAGLGRRDGRHNQAVAGLLFLTTLERGNVRSKRSNIFHLIGIALATIILVGASAAATTVGGVTLTLHSYKYYKHWDMTRFVYRISKTGDAPLSCWILGVGDCVSDERIDWAASSPFIRTDEPIEGLMYTQIAPNRKFTLWLVGQWDLGLVDVAVVRADLEGADAVSRGTMEGPACSASMLSVDVVSGQRVDFPQIMTSGTFEASSLTRLEVTSTLSGWALDWDLSFGIPESADASVVQRVFGLTVYPYVAGAGSTAIDVHYALTISDDDFSGLPEGGYQIGITYTVTSD